MGEGSETTTTSPVPGSGAQSPTPHTAPLHSPGGSPPIGRSSCCGKFLKTTKGLYVKIIVGIVIHIKC